MRKRFKNLLYLISFLIIGLLVLAGGYYVYITYVSDTADIKVSGALSINYHDGSKLKIKGNKKTKISIINGSDEDIYYYVEFKNLKNINDVEYQLTNNDDININDTLKSYNTLISSYILIKGNETENYELSFKSKDENYYRVEVNIGIESLETNTFAEVILKNNEVKSSSVTAIGSEIATTDEGLIMSTDDSGTTYYFRGNVQNNNVSINGINYKIVRINGDGTVRLILDGQADTLKKYYDLASKYSFAQSNVSMYLNSWVNDKLKGYTVFLSNQKYCNDNAIENGVFHALTRIKVDNIPSFICLGEKVLSKVGLLTVDEAIYAGAVLGTDNDQFYLYNKDLTADYYLMTSAQYNTTSYYPFMVTTKGKVVETESGENLRAVRPVINIIKTATVDGDGTVNNPYKIIK